MKALVLVALLAGCDKGKPSSTTFDLTITDGGKPIAARVLLFASDGKPLHIGKIDLYNQRQGAAACEFAPGVIGTWDGIVVASGVAELPVGRDRCAPSPAIPYGHYKVWAWHGFDHERWEGEVDLSANRGKVALAIALKSAWTAPPNVLAADLHVHAHDSNDSGMPDTQRVAAQVAAGIQVIGLANHNQNGDVADAIDALGLAGVVSALPSNEITSEMMHAGVYPAIGSALPEGQIVKADPKALLALLHTLPGPPVIQINHPRFRYQSLFDTTHWDGVTWPPPFPTDFDAIEVVAGYSAANAPGDRRLDEVLRDFYTFYKHGRPVAATGGSDTHDFNWVLDGTARTYAILDAPPRPGAFNHDRFVAAIRARRTMASSGPWLDVQAWPTAEHTGLPAGPGQFVIAHDGKLHLVITTAQAGWMHATRIRIQIGDTTIEKPFGNLELDVDVGADDTFVGVAVDGDEPLPLELTGTYQRDKWNKPGVTPFAVISPILVDADGDHHWKRGDTDLRF
ncbi:MAG: CehA/McbA family metallohydrolase [Kofleriaceae bacterium]